MRGRSLVRGGGGPGAAWFVGLMAASSPLAAVAHPNPAPAAPPAVPPAAPAPAPSIHANLVRIEEMAEEYRSAYPDVVEVTADALLAAPDTARIFVDVREPEEWAVSRIPGSLARADFERQRAEDPHAFDGREIVTYCTIGYRSGVYARNLNEHGIPAVNLRGSLLAWAHAAGPLVDDAGPTRRVHVYGRRWSLLPEGYEPVW